MSGCTSSDDDDDDLPQCMFMHVRYVAISFALVECWSPLDAIISTGSRNRQAVSHGLSCLMRAANMREIQLSIILQVARL